MDDDSPLSELTTASDLTNESINLKRGISSDHELFMDDTQSRAENTGTHAVEHQLSDQETNEVKRRRIHEDSRDSASLSSTFNREISQDTFPESSRETSQAPDHENTNARQQTRTMTRSSELRRPVKRVNYAETGGSDEFEEEEGYYATSSHRSRTRSKKPLAYDSEDDEDDVEQGGYQAGGNHGGARTMRTGVRATGEETSIPTGKSSSERTLRDRRTISAPKPFPVDNPAHRTRPRLSNLRHPHSRSHRGSSLRRSGLHDRDEDSEDLHHSRSRQPISRLRQPAPAPAPRPIVEGMRITRAMLSSLHSDLSLSREATPDQLPKSKGQGRSGYDHELSYDEDDEMEGQEQESQRGDEEEDEGGMNGNLKSRLDSPSLQGQDGVRMTRLRARALMEPSKEQQHNTTSSSRPKSRPSHSHSHAQDELESNKKYDLRERPKNRPTYIADRPVNTSTRQRNARLGVYSNRDQYSRSRSSRPSLLDSLLRAGGGSSSDEMGHSNYKKRSGGGESRSSSSRFLPMNLRELGDSRLNAIATRSEHLADTDPLAINKTVDFDHVGGLDHHIKDLKEMVILPLLYPEVYKHFQITPPRGVLFHGPPGTGKTLLARALATSCSTETQKVAFFMRKGADVLSKWVGEAERQLRLLFEEAKAWQPSIIFFDEIDGLCPVRSSKQEQIHASIVSTMLALMDGLDSRGQVIVIGATNRIDALDPALRRPGRFDREFYFPLPGEMARRKIIDINTRGWEPPLDENFKNELARMTTRYCGADIKALCTEAALKAIRRRYPQIYDSTEKLQIDASKIIVEEVDLLKSARALVPAASRITGAVAAPIPPTLLPLLGPQFNTICSVVDTLFPRKSKRSGGTGPHTQRITHGEGDDGDDEDFSFQSLGYRSLQRMRTFRPRLLVAGTKGMGQRYIGPALLHHLEGCTVQPFDLAALMSESSRTPEAACVQFFIETKRHVPSVIYIPHIDTWWNVTSSVVRATFANLLDDLNPEDSILFLATTETPFEELPIACQRWFMTNAKSTFDLTYPDVKSCEEFFGPILQDIVRSPKDFVAPRKPSTQALEKLKKAPPPQPRVPTAEEKRLLCEHDAYVFRELRISLRTIVDELFKERKFKPFFRPVEPEESVDYYEIVKKPMDLTTINDKVDNHAYLTVKDFLADIDLIVENASLYNDINDPSRIVYRARAFQDVVHAMIGRLDPELIMETEKSATRWRQDNKVAAAQQKAVQGERTSRRRQGLEPMLVLDDPEMLLRHRSQPPRQANNVEPTESGADGKGKQQQQQQQQTQDDLNTGEEATVDAGREQKDHTQDESGEQEHANAAHSSQLQAPLTLMEDIQQVGDLSTNHTDIDMATASSSQHVADTAETISTEIKIEPTMPDHHLLMDNATQHQANIDQQSPEEDGTALDANRQPHHDERTLEAESMEDIHNAQGSMGEKGGDHDARETISDATTAKDGDEVQAADEEQQKQAQSDGGDACNPDTAEEEEEEEEEEEVERVVEVDEMQLTKVKDYLLQSSRNNLSIEDLDQLRAALYHDIWEHRADWNKTELLQAMENTISRLILHFQRLRLLEDAERQAFSRQLLE